MTPATLYHGTLPLILSGPDPALGPDGVLDALEWEILCRTATFWQDLSDMGLAHKRKVEGYGNMWVQSITPKREDSLNTLVRISAIGTVNRVDKRARQIGGAGLQLALGPQDGQSWEDPDGTTSDKWNIKDRTITVTDTYFSDKQPSTEVVGTALPPPEAPGTPAFLWGHLSTTWRANYPKGWVLDDRKIIQHFRNSPVEGLWEVTDTFTYYHIATPE